MKAKRAKRESFEQLEKLAHQTDDIRPLSPALRSGWATARRTAEKLRARRRRGSSSDKRVVPVLIDRKLLDQIDRYAKSEGLSRSALVAEGLKLRMKSRPDARAISIPH